MFLRRKVIESEIAQENRSRARSPSIMAEAAFHMLSQPGASYTGIYSLTTRSWMVYRNFFFRLGNFEIDELFLRKKVGWKTEDFKQFNGDDISDEELVPDFFIPQVGLS
jgi:hypothetical protein